MGFFSAALRGPAGGMLACLLLAAMLGGIAMANPEALRRSDRSETPRGGASHGGGTAIREAGGHHDDDGHGRDGHDGDASGDATDTVAACREIVAHLQGDVRTGDDRGLEHAIEVVSRNCRTHAAAPGLLHALDRLVENLERWQERHGDDAGSNASPPGRGNGDRNGGNPPGQPAHGSPGNGGASNAEGATPTAPDAHSGGSSGSSSSGGNGSGPPSARAIAPGTSFVASRRPG